jgi:hypothetical protein
LLGLWGGRNVVGMTVRIEAVEEDVEFDVSVLSSVGSSGKAGSGGNFDSLDRRKSLGWSITVVTTQE